jgi:hypothetical protein
VKKFAIGCGAALLLLGIAASVATYYFVYRPARSFYTSMTELGTVADLDRALTNTAPYTPPATSALTAPQLQRFLAVQQTVKTRLGTRFSELDAKYKALDQETRGGQRSVRLTEMVGAYQDLFGIITDARRAQVDALNAQQFSKDEYAWVRLRVYEAAGLQFIGVDLNDIVDKVKQGTFELPTKDAANPERALRSIPEENKTLVAPHLEVLEEWVPYAIFGL